MYFKIKHVYQKSYVQKGYFSNDNNKLQCLKKKSYNLSVFTYVEWTTRDQSTHDLIKHNTKHNYEKYCCLRLITISSSQSKMFLQSKLSTKL